MLDKHHAKRWTTPDGHVLTATVSPCSWMYSGYGLQIMVKLDGGGEAIFHAKDVAWEAASEADFDALTGRVRLIPCARCGKPVFDPNATNTNRKGLCEGCFMGDLNKELEAALEAEQVEIERTDAEMLAKGYTHRVEACVHPEQGEDLQVAFYFQGAPSKADIRATLKKEGSVVFDDYQIIELKPQEGK